MISIAHRLSTIKKDNKMIVMYGEGVVEDENYIKHMTQIRCLCWSCSTKEYLYRLFK